MDTKILKYELKRIIFSRIFVITFIIALFFSVIDLYTEIIQVVSGTAPFSKWSYCKFLCDINTIMLLILMLSCTGLFSRNEQRVREITSCTSLPKKKYLATKSLALSISYLIIAICCIFISFVFYKTTFNFAGFQNFLLPMLIILLPTFVFVLGTSMFLGSKSQTLLYAWIPIVLILSLISFNSAPFIDIFAKGYVTYMPTVISVDSLGEPIFSLHLNFIMSRLIFTLVGMVLYAASFKKLSGKA
ncbi:MULTISPECIES: hypothetical protein [Clostridium]|uniref:ABC-2 family transporter protein n=2 Tax=Clostridium TaxID=1485 RepID=D8GMY5_CLOLD|nr:MULTISPECIES: hypothetical protein [Clostridium]ADK15773.1 conserved hypothetical protein [Clostridium ljungdahlii DSM 13528]AGY75028.1 hypothetical protein CAETHG_0801 [Clostridium autoethanogenum DSM 10061]ALU35201.1 putative membrane protein [Clostridium autoethanogenum DSM 10061]OAA86403.1 ABC-2 family transporter protein [Clostridium ljungdahlii DSM 13528]OVY49298.1 ABC-2 family transporter protein [Clostridium autoethanogenum]